MKRKRAIRQTIEKLSEPRQAEIDAHRLAAKPNIPPPPLPLKRDEKGLPIKNSELAPIICK